MNKIYWFCLIIKEKNWFGGNVYTRVPTIAPESEPVTVWNKNELFHTAYGLRHTWHWQAINISMELLKGNFYYVLRILLTAYVKEVINPDCLLNTSKK